MAKLSDKEQVNEYITKLGSPLKESIEYLRQFILQVDPEIGEQIKWNNPSFYYSGEMKAFDPKEYKRDMIVFNLHKGKIMLVFPSGAKVNDTSGLLDGKFTDERKIVVFTDLEDIKAKEKDLQQVIKTWLRLLRTSQ
ncbi:DUF1801 domain-containing protein [Pedobacter insulae]|uniref:YdhG-like domain-containing protein n=1 Tax=Pedobacter insulae TaxID=414048 RepID=A0A1I2Y764_9SPHI|nr:DUF1801 domain-containing protein [Pedobacter insulae]SFH20191.1 hypothetical protein SAMN04489864_106202 [Pedobacter insulae]